MDDDLNRGLPSDRFDVDWWVNSQRVNLHLSRRRRKPLELIQYLKGGTPILNKAKISPTGFPHPAQNLDLKLDQALPIIMVEIPADFQSLKASDLSLALDWRIHTRSIFEELFKAGYLVTDFVRTDNPSRRSYYVLCYGESTL